MADLQQIPSATWTGYLQLAEATVCRYQGEPDWDEIHAHVMEEVAFALSRLPQERAETAWRLVPKVAREAVAGWLRSPENRRRKTTRAGHALPELLSWERLAESGEGAVWGTRVPDFAPRLIHRLWAREVLAEALALMTEAQRLRTWRYLIGEPLAEDGEAASEANALFAGGLNRYLRHHGLPVKRHGRETTRRTTDAAAERDRRAAWARDRYWREKQGRHRPAEEARHES